MIDSESKDDSEPVNEIKSLTSSLESNLCDYSEAYILVTENINISGGNNNTDVAFKNCAPFKKCRTEINATFVHEAEHINIAMPMYNLTECSNNYSDTSGSLWQLKRDGIEGDVDLIVDTSSSFKYILNFIGDTVADGANRKKEGVKIAAPLKYLSNFWRSLEVPLINCKIKFSLKWYGKCILSNSGSAATFKITNTKLYVPVVTLKLKTIQNYQNY